MDSFQKGPAMPLFFPSQIQGRKVSKEKNADDFSNKKTGDSSLSDQPSVS